ncbi:GpE family phage tail protein [Acinetobacter courvalinii]|uniref:GpE family phage tail protein n=1 Tax=Acinetobacter courvalinii TaxID=280147 RepID=UPI0027E4F518|nr:GpE family phage tail protein [Acinetobacter courvalinii]
MLGRGINQFFGECKGEIPSCVDEVIANLAVIFGWTPKECEDFEIDELMRWNERAKARSEVQK